MRELLKELFLFLKKPILVKDENTNFNYRFTIFLRLLILSLATGFVISPVFSILENLEIINLDNHASKQMIKEFSKIQVVLFTVILAPLLEELIFRAPITAFKNPKYFGFFFYLLAILFGYIHITNFEISQNILLVSPILVLPQILLGGYLGFIRVRFGLIWSIALHASYNGILVSISLLFETS